MLGTLSEERPLLFVALWIWAAGGIPSFYVVVVDHNALGWFGAALAFLALLVLALDARALLRAIKEDLARVQP